MIIRWSGHQSFTTLLILWFDLVVAITGPKSLPAITVDPPDLNQFTTPERQGKSLAPKVLRTWFSVFTWSPQSESQAIS